MMMEMLEQDNLIITDEDETFLMTMGHPLPSGKGTQNF